MANKTEATEIREIFSQNLKYYRVNSNISQEKLGEKAKISDKYVSDLERNLYDPSLKTIDSLAKALNIDTYLLLKYDETHKDVQNKIWKTQD